VGDLQLSEIRDQVRYNIDNRSDLTDAQINRWINRTYRHVSLPTVYRHHELESLTTVALVTSTVSYSLSSTNLLSVHNVWFFSGANTNITTNRRPLQLTTFREIQSQNVISSGEPFRYTIHGSSLYIDRSPTSTINGYYLQLEGVLRPTELSSSTDVTVLAPVWDEVLAAGATWRGYQAIGEPELSSVWESNFAQLINEITNIYNYEARDQGYTMRVRSRLS
jgi:hypothetical protein